MKLTDHITYAEACHSDTAKRKGISNIPSEDQLWNMIKLGSMIFEPLREWAGGAIKISSFFRSEQLNQAIGGSSSSQHCKGQAFDLDDVYGHKTNADMFDYITTHLDFDQIIWEFGTDENPDWIHVSYVSPEENRRSILRAYRIDGKVQYKPM